MPTTLPLRKPVARESDAFAEWMVLLGNVTMLGVVVAEVIGLARAQPLLLSGTDYLGMMMGP